MDNSRKLIGEMNRYYDQRAPWHDYYMGYESNEKMENLLAPIVEKVAEIVSGKRVLELACGTGNWTRVLAQRARSVTAADISLAALKIARGKLGSYDNVSLIQSDAYNSGGIDGRFDVVFASDWWSHIPKGVLPSFLESVIGKLKPQSTAVFLDMSFRDFFRQEPCYYDSDHNRVSRRELPDGTMRDVVKNFPDEQELRGVLDACSRKIEYFEFPDLERWMVVFIPK